jgi:hypothetical protein
VAARSGLQLRSNSPCRGPALLTFSLPSAAEVRLTVHDLTGRCLATLFSGSAAAGQHAHSWHAGAGPRRSAGVYFARLEAAGSVVTRKLVLSP